MHAGYSGLGRGTFIEYQERGLKNLREFSRRWNWLSLALPTNESVDLSVDRVRTALQLGTQEAKASSEAP
jgi:hypothetical protein